MNANSPTIPGILRGDPGDLRQSLADDDNSSILRRSIVAVIGCAIYGATLGVWQGGWMPAFTALKIPLVILITLGANGFLNGILSLLLGSGLGIRKTLAAQLTAFMVAALILASLSPITYFLARNLADPHDVGGERAHAVFLLTHTLLIGFAGLTANAKLFDLLRNATRTHRTACTTYLAWLAGNFLAGSQIAWFMRPFFGTPGLPVQFLRDDPLAGNFLETVWFAFNELLPPEWQLTQRVLLLSVLGVIGIVLTLPKSIFTQTKNQTKQ